MPRQKCLGPVCTLFCGTWALKCSKMTGLIINGPMFLRQNSTNDVTSVKALEKLSSACSGGRATAHLKARAHVPPNLLHCIVIRLLVLQFNCISISLRKMVYCAVGIWFVPVESLPDRLMCALCFRILLFSLFQWIWTYSLLADKTASTYSSFCYAHSCTETQYWCHDVECLKLFEIRAYVNWILGHAIAQAVSHRLPTAAARVRAQVRSCGICGRQSGIRQVFSEYFGFPR
jgi:hypothetical protein